jgi:hypothetical protein
LVSMSRESATAADGLLGALLVLVWKNASRLGSADSLFAFAPAMTIA